MFLHSSQSQGCKHKQRQIQRHTSVEHTLNGIFPMLLITFLTLSVQQTYLYSRDCEVWDLKLDLYRWAAFSLLHDYTWQTKVSSHQIFFTSLWEKRWFTKLNHSLIIFYLAIIKTLSIINWYATWQIIWVLHYIQKCCKQASRSNAYTIVSGRRGDNSKKNKQKF